LKGICAGSKFASLPSSISAVTTVCCAKVQALEVAAIFAELHEHSRSAGHPLNDGSCGQRRVFDHPAIRRLSVAQGDEANVATTLLPAQIPFNVKCWPGSPSIRPTGSTNSCRGIGGRVRRREVRRRDRGGHRSRLHHRLRRQHARRGRRLAVRAVDQHVPGRRLPSRLRRRRGRRGAVPRRTAISARPLCGSRRIRPLGFRKGLERHYPDVR
jgi:hypothetical protein